jgi:maleylacetoacetate isomerase
MSRCSGQCKRYDCRALHGWTVPLNSAASGGAVRVYSILVFKDDAMSNDVDFELFGFWRTASTYRVRVALNLKGLSARERFVDLDKGEHRTPEFLSINPFGVIPALLEQGHAPITQSLSILEFLEEKYPEPALLPAELHGRARVRSIAAMLATDTNPLLTPRVKKYLFVSGGFDEASWRAWQTHWLQFCLEAVERQLVTDSATGDFCHGDKVTIADICLASMWTIAQAFSIHVDNIPTIEGIITRCNTLDAFVRAHPLLQEGAPSRIER